MISVITLTYNQETTIEAHLQSLSFADEIIVLDAHSADDTVEIAKNHTSKVFQQKFENLADQKEFSVAQAQNDWICFLRLEEKVSSDLKEEINTIIKADNPKVAYQAQRDFYFMGKLIKYTGFQKDTAICLFHKKHFNFRIDQLDKKIDSGKIGRLKHHLQLDSYRDFDSYNQRLTEEGQIEAQELFNQNIRPNLFHFLWKPWAKFMQKYFLQLGFRDGKEGFILSYILAFAVFKRYLKLWTLYRKID